MVDGAGVRTAIFLSGCAHHCDQCQNPETWNPEYGAVITIKTIQHIADEINKRDFVKGITLTGGDPFFHASATFDFLVALKAKLNKPVSLWIYTGYTYEQLREDTDMLPLLMASDVLVDGPFVWQQKDKRLRFRGSRNQRIIDVQKSLETGDVVLWQKR